MELFGEGTLLTGGVDRTVCVVDFHREGEGLRVLHRRRLHRTVNCQGLKTEGILPDGLRQKLEALR